MSEDEFGDNMGDLGVAEQKAFERAGPTGKLAELLTGGQEVGKKKETVSPEDRFLIAVDALSRKINDESKVKISQNDIDEMLERTRSIRNLKYKNPAGYILGYVASRGGRSLKEKDVKEVIDHALPLVAETNGVEPSDVLRYARFWRTL